MICKQVTLTVCNSLGGRRDQGQRRIGEPLIAGTRLKMPSQ